METIITIVGCTIIIGGLLFMRSVIKYLEKELIKQKDIIQEQADEIEYLNFIINLKKYGKVATCQSWIVDRWMAENKDSINADDILNYNIMKLKKESMELSLSKYGDLTSSTK